MHTKMLSPALKAPEPEVSGVGKERRSVFSWKGSACIFALLRLRFLPLAALALASSCAGAGNRAAFRDAGADRVLSVLEPGIRPGPGTEELRLSRYGAGLAGTPGDVPVYILDSGISGSTLLAVGGTHADEIAGSVAAALLVERARPTRGRLIVLPCLNGPGLSDADPGNPRASRIRVEAASGTRYIRIGARLVPPGRSGPDRSLPPYGDVPPGEYDRDINRAYPGAPDGPLAHRIAAAVMELLITEGVDIAVDMHEAPPESPTAWVVVANPKNLGVAVSAVFDLEDRGFDLIPERSPEDFRGLSHREWGDRTGALAFLVETANPALGLRDGPAPDQLRHPEHPLWRRVAVHLEVLAALVRSFNAEARDGPVLYEGVPSYGELEARGLEGYL